MAYLRAGKISLPKEIVLMIIEKIEYEPGMLEKIMDLSDNLGELLRSHERSLSMHYARLYQPILAPVYASTTKPNPAMLHPRSFPWLAELHLRASFLQNLKHQVVYPAIRTYCRRNIRIQLCDSCLDKNFEDKFRGVEILFKVFDAPMQWLKARSLVQEECIRGLSTKHLAFLQLTLTIASEEYTRRLTRKSMISRGASIELECVFRELMLRNGPYLVWASLGKGVIGAVLVEKTVDEGLQELRDYEASRSSSMTRCLQSFVMQEYCRRVNCKREAAWDELNKTIEEEFCPPSNPHMH